MKIISTKINKKEKEKENRIRLNLKILKCK